MLVLSELGGGVEGQRGCGCRKWRGKSTMVRVKQSEDMGESTSPQRIQSEEMVLKDKNDGEEMETDNGLQAGLRRLPVSFFLFLPLTHNNSYINCAHKRRWMQVAVRLFHPQICIGLFFVPSLSSC